MKSKKAKKTARAKHNRSAKHARRRSRKYNGAHARTRYSSRRKRNGADSGVAMKVLKVFGAFAAGVAIAIGGMMLLSATSLSAAAQDGILIAGGVVLGGAAIAMGYSQVGLAILVGPATLGWARRALSWGITSRAQELISSIQSTVTPTTTTTPATTAPAQGFYGFQPGGFLTATPSWQPGMAQESIRPDSLVNFTTPMGPYALG